MDIPSYEVYFRIETGEEDFFLEQEGKDLRTGEKDIRQFDKELLKQPAIDVVVEDVTFEGSS